MSKMKEKALEIEELLRDQAGQILYFESSMEEDSAFQMVLERLRFIYEAGVQEGKEGGSNA